jgi:hypothetical protein
MTILNHLRDSVHLKYFHLQWIPHQLTEQLLTARVQKHEELLPLLQSMAVNKFHTIVMGDESWFTLEYQHSAKWSVHREEGPERARQQISTTKFILTVIWGVGGFHGVDLMTAQRSFDSQYFVSNVMTPLIANIFPQGEFRTLVDCTFICITIASTFQVAPSGVAMAISQERSARDDRSGWHRTRR